MPTTIYFDGLPEAGIRNPDKKRENLFIDYFNEEEIKLYQGAAERMLSMKQKFDYYFFVDNDKPSIKSLEQK